MAEQQQNESDGVPVWIVESFVHTDIPKVEKYTAIRVKATGVTVKRWAGIKYIPGATHRRFFLTEEEMLQHVETHARSMLSLAQSRVKNLTTFLTDPAKHLEVRTVPSVPSATPEEDV